MKIIKHNRRISIATFFAIVLFVALCITIYGAINLSGMDKFIPTDRCVKSAYDDNSQTNKLSINCKNHDGRVHTIVIRRIVDIQHKENARNSIESNKKIEIGQFVCSEFSNLHTCFSTKKSIMITAIDNDSLSFFIQEFEKQAL